MSFTAPKFTGVGRQLHTRVIAGDTLTFTVIKLGDGTMTTEPITALTDLIHGIIALPVHEVRRNADYAEVTGVFQNAGLSSGFYWREIGIFAADPDYPNDRSHDILYCYQNAAELAEYIPSASSAVIEKIIRVACVVGDAENVTVGLASQAYAKAEDLQALEEQHSKDVERINNALDAVDPTKITAKAAPADGDGVMIADSADGGKAKRLLWSSVKTALEQVFSDVRTAVSRHIADKSNPHEVTAKQAEAMPLVPVYLAKTDDVLKLPPGRYRYEGSDDEQTTVMNLPVKSWHWEIIVIGQFNVEGTTSNYKIITVENNAGKIYHNALNWDTWSGWSEVILSSNIGAQNVNAAKYALDSTVIDAFVLRNSAIVGGEVTPGANGLIAWQYG